MSFPPSIIELPGVGASQSWSDVSHEPKMKEDHPEQKRSVKYASPWLEKSPDCSEMV
jgi:hypothetical protein